MKKKATEDQFNELHNLVTNELLARIKSGEASTQDIKAAIEGNALDKLANIIPTVDPELVQKRLYGKSYS